MDPIRRSTISKRVKFRNQRNWVLRNSEPRILKKPKKVDRGKIRPVDDARIDGLAAFRARKKYISPNNDPTSWAYMLKHPVKESAKTYTASEKIVELAEPRGGRPPKPSFSDTVHFKPRIDLTQITCSERLERLRQPKVPYKPYKEKPQVTEAALKAEASSRVVKLAEPRIRKVEVNEFAFTINPIAFAYFPTKRIRQLAKPKHLTTPEELEATWKKQQERKVIFDQKRAAKAEAKKKAIAERHKKERKGLGI